MFDGCAKTALCRRIFFPILWATAIVSCLCPSLTGQGGTLIPIFDRQDFRAGEGAKGVAAIDLNGDGLLDLVTADEDGGTVTLLLNSGTLEVAAVFEVGRSPGAIAAADFDGNGFPDIAVANFRDSTVSILLQFEAPQLPSRKDAKLRQFKRGQIQMTPRNIAVGRGPSDIAVGDFDGDGQLDLAVPSVFSDTISIIFGNIEEGFQQALEIRAGEGPQSIGVGDFTNDGVLDLIVANLFGDGVTVFQGIDGVFLPVEPIPDAEFQARNFEQDALVVDVAVSDFNLDGNLDAAFINTVRPEVRLFLGDGEGGLTLFQALPVSQGPRRVAIADVNSDDVNDIVVLSGPQDQVSLLLGRRFSGPPFQGGAPFSEPLNYSVGDLPQDLALGALNGDPGLDLFVTFGNQVSVLTSSGAILGGGLPALTVSPPQIVAVGPTQGPTAGGTVLLIDGINFNNVTSVTVGGAAATQMLVAPTNRIKLVVPAGAAAGMADITVTTLSGSDTATGAFAYVAAGDPIPEVDLRFQRLIYCNSATGTSLPGLANCILNSSKDSDPGDMDADGTLDIYSAKTFSSMSFPDEIYFNSGTAGLVMGTFQDDLGVMRSAGLATGLFTVTPGVVIGEALAGKIQYDVQLADLDGMNGLDVVALSTATVRILINDGTGTLTETTSTSITGFTPDSAFGLDDVDVGDLDNNGSLDILAASRSSGRQPIILFNDGAANFTVDLSLLATAATGAGFTAEHASHDVELADIDNDGDLDVIFSGVRSGDAPRIFLNTLSETGLLGFQLVFPMDLTRFDPAPTTGFSHVAASRPFGPSDAADTFNKRRVISVDFNNDGLTDIWFGDQGIDEIYINRGGSMTGFFTRLQNVPFPMGFTYGGSSGDFDLDGRTDILQGDYHGQPMIFLNRIVSGTSINDINASSGRPFEAVPEPMRIIATGAIGSRREALSGGSFWQAATNATTGGLDEPDMNKDGGFLPGTGTRTGFLGSFTQLLDGDAGDFDADGDLDVVFSLGDHSDRSNRIFLNLANPASLPNSDLWMRDNNSDTGAVPSSGTLWLSPDVWNRLNPDCAPSGASPICSDADHQNPISGQTNYLYAKIRNNRPAAQMVKRAAVNFRLGKAATGLIWPDSFSLVGEITVLDLLPGEVRNIGPLPWRPPNPSPSDHFCFYIRILSTQDPISIAEGSSVSNNTRDSNNIAWRNVNILAGSMETVSFILRNVSQEAQPVNLVFTTPEAFFERGGKIRVEMEEEIFNRWLSESRRTEGLFVQGSTLHVTVPWAGVLDIPMQGLEEGQVRMTFEYTNGDFEFLVSQEQEGEVVGGILYKTPPR